MSATTNNSVLKIGTILNGSGKKYKIIDTLGQGGFGITYLAVATVVIDNIPGEMKFAIKEHFPSSTCRRVGQSVVLDEDKRDEFKSSLSDFISEAKKLHSLGIQNENIVKVNEVFEENGTAYYVMQYINGESLASYVKSKGKLPYHEAISLLSPIFDAVDFLHKSRINHLDIKPENIMLHRGMDGTTPILIDFGLSIHFKKNGDKTSPKGVEGISEGYSPLEQYAGIKEFNPATDIYALAATLLYALTGTIPKSAAEIRSSEIRSSLANLAPQNVIDGICKAMNKSYEDRTSSISNFKADLGISSVGGSVTQILDKGEEKKKSYFRTALIGLLLIAIVVLGIILLTRQPAQSDSNVEPIPTDTIQNIITSEEIGKESDHTQETVPEKNENPSKLTSEVEEKPIKPNPTVSTAPQEPKVTEGILQLGYGSWKGGIKNGKPDGKGRLTFTSSHRVDRSSSVEANQGDYFVATYDNGSLISGKLYDSAGNLLQTIIP